MMRSGVCKICGKKFITEYEKFESIRQYWQPDICEKCLNGDKNEEVIKNKN